MTFLAITTMRNEGPHCLEWIAHHLAIGFDDFLIYSNDCDDGTDNILNLLEQAGIVTHESAPSAGKQSVQWRAFKHASDHRLFKQADWVLVADCDEFINLRAPLESLTDLVQVLPESAEALAMPWRLFGNSEKTEMKDCLTIERFVNAAPVGINLPLAHFFKSLFRPHNFRQIGVHRPKRKNGQEPVWVDASGNFIPESFASSDNRINLFGHTVGSDLVQLNHYSLRAAENFIVKRSRGLPNHMNREIGLGYWAERNFNTVQDCSIHRMLPGTQAKFDELMQIPGMEELHKKAFLSHCSKFESAMTQRDELQLFWQIGLLQSSQPPTAAAVRTHLGRFAKLC